MATALCQPALGMATPTFAKCHTFLMKTNCCVSKAVHVHHVTHVLPPLRESSLVHTIFIFKTGLRNVVGVTTNPFWRVHGCVFCHARFLANEMQLLAAHILMF